MKWIIALVFFFSFLSYLYSAKPLENSLGNSLDNQDVESFVVSNPNYFAEVDESGTVLRVIVADQAFINSGAVGDPARWVPTVKEVDKEKGIYPAEINSKYQRATGKFEPKAKDIDILVVKATST